MSEIEIKRLDLPYYTPELLEKESFIKMPAIFFPPLPDKKDPAYRSGAWDTVLSQLSSEEKVLYCLLRDRMGLSYNPKNINRFTDDEGRVFVIMEYEEMQKRMHISRPTAIKLLRHLEQVGLIMTTRGYNPKSKKNMPNKYYVMDANAFAVIKGDNHVKKIDMENQVKKIDMENQVKNTDRRILEKLDNGSLKEIDSSHINFKQTDEIRIEEMAEIIKKRVSYDEYVEFLYKHDGQELATAEMVVVDKLVKEMVRIMLSTKKYYVIKGENVTTAALQKKVKSMDINDFIVIVSKLLHYKGPIKKAAEFTRAVIWNYGIDSMDNLSTDIQEVQFIKEEIDKYRWD